MRQRSIAIPLSFLCGAMVSAAGCTTLQDARGRRVDLSEYAGIVVHEVQAAPDVEYEDFPEAVSKYLRWRLQSYPRLQPSAPTSESDGEAQAASRPLYLNVRITEVDLPSKADQVVWGASRSATCEVSVSAEPDGPSLGTARVYGSCGSSSPSIVSAGLVGMVMNLSTARDYTEQDRLVLAMALADKVVEVLDRSMK